jgi:hypothetical protein
VPAGAPEPIPSSIPLGAMPSPPSGPAASPAPSSPAAPAQQPAKQKTPGAFARTFPGVGARIAASLAFVVALLGGFGGALAAKSAFAFEASTARTLFVRSTPSGATVTLDGERVGTTPLVLDVALEDGPHQLKIAPLAAVGGEPRTRKLTLKKNDRTLSISENMLAKGKVTIDTRPSGARLSLDGVDVGAPTPITLEISTDKAHVIEARLEGFAAQTATIPMDRGEQHTLIVPLTSTRGEGRVVLQSHPAADLWMDGQPWGRTGDKARTCPAGAHEIVLIAPGVPPSTYTVDVPESGTARYFFDLRMAP